MATNRFLSGSLLFLCSCVSALAADDGWQQRDARMRKTKYYFVEFCMKVGPAQTLQVELDTPYAVDFNIHSHTEKGTLFPVRETVEGERAFEIVADEGGDYCVMFKNPENRTEAFVVRTRYRIR
ncbi:MAG TPA: hypothetical protein VF254_07595 [Gammaproteobacteria bacterium]